MVEKCKIKANREYHTEVYDSQVAAGKLAAESGQPREPKDEHGDCFWYSYAGLCWLEGYDSIIK